MTDQFVMRQAAPDAVRDEKRHAILEALIRLHAADDERAFLDAASAAFAAVLREPPIAVRIAYEGGEPADSGVATHAAVARTMDRAALDGHIAIDDVPPGGVALPINVRGRAPGAVYLLHPDASRLPGSLLPALRTVADHAALAHANLSARMVALSAPSAAADAAFGLTLPAAKFAFERRLVARRLAEARGNVAAAARAIGIDRGQLARLMKRHGLDRATFGARTGRKEVRGEALEKG